MKEKSASSSDNGTICLLINGQFSAPGNWPHTKKGGDKNMQKWQRNPPMAALFLPASSWVLTKNSGEKESLDFLPPLFGTSCSLAS